MKVLLAHPGKQHSFQTATALKKSGFLLAYMTTVYDKPGSLTARLKRFLSASDRRKASTRRCEALDDGDVILCCEWSYLISLFLFRFRQIAAFRERHRQRTADRFGREVAERAIALGADAVILYDTTALACFRVLQKRAPQILRILDVSALPCAAMRRSLEADMEASGDRALAAECPWLWDDNVAQNALDEIRSADCCFAPSSVVAESLVEAGANRKNTVLVPYGVDPARFPPAPKKEGAKPFRLLYVGQISHRKGLHHLLSACERMAEEEVELELVGAYGTGNPLYQAYKDAPRIRFAGFVPRDKLCRHYQAADLFVFPSLGEGFGLVMLEAMCSGLPVVASDRAGGCDLIENGVNGIVVPVADESALVEKVRWCIDHPDACAEMGRRARETATAYTWEAYDRRVAAALEHWKLQRFEDRAPLT